MIIGIIGVGYVGLPLAIAFAKYYKVICYDVNKKRISELQKGLDSNKQHTKKELNKNKIFFTDDEVSLKKINIYIITVPTPITESNQPDLDMLEKASILVGKSMNKKTIIIYESTTYPGCTEEFCIPVLEKTSKLKFARDFFVAYSPERVNPGDKINTLKNITKIVGANDKKTLKIVKKLYQNICKSIHTVPNINIAEAAKVIENIQRDVNIALVNEFSVLFNKLNISNDKVLKAASTKWNFHYYKPGLVGGHCIGIDPYYLAYKAKLKNYYPQLILSGRRFNENMGRYIANQAVKLLSINNIATSKAKIAILGFSFKENISDYRNTKVSQIIHELKSWKTKVEVFDSQVSALDVKREYGIKVYKTEKLKNKKFDAVIIAVSHKEFIKKLSYYDFFFKNKNKKIIVDVKNIFFEEDLIKNNYSFFQL
jgi:UDP-N-acetyl-D-galactosamine dehydrogenase